MIALLKDLQEEHKFKILMKVGTWVRRDLLIDRYYNVEHEVSESSKYSEPTVWIKHYGVIDFRNHGALWSPYFFTIIRNPINRVNKFVLEYILTVTVML